MKCPNCGHEWETRATKAVKAAKRDLKAGLGVLRHPGKGLKQAFKKPCFPDDCKRNCTRKCDSNE